MMGHLQQTKSLENKSKIELYMKKRGKALRFGEERHQPAFGDRSPSIALKKDPLPETELNPVLRAQ